MRQAVSKRRVIAVLRLALDQFLHVSRALVAFTERGGQPQVQLGILFVLRLQQRTNVRVLDLECGRANGAAGRRR
jgi:hypothetical protein